MALPSGLRILADCLINMSAVSLSSSSIHRMGDIWDFLVDKILRWVFILSSLSRNSMAAAFLMSLYFGSFMSSVMGVAEMCSGCIGLRPTLLLAVLNIFLSFSSCVVVVGVRMVSLMGGVLDGLFWFDGPHKAFPGTEA